MSGKRALILAGMGFGLLWALGLFWLGPQIGQGLSLWEAGFTAAFCAGLPLLAMIMRLAQRRFFDDQIIDGQHLSGGAAIDQKVLNNTIEQLVLAACIWPLAGHLLGAGMVLALGYGFAVSRLAFWLGYHLSPPIRGAGFAAGFYPTVLIVLYALWRLWSVDLPM